MQNHRIAINHILQILFFTKADVDLCVNHVTKVPMITMEL